MALLSIVEQNRSLALYYGANKGSIASPSHWVALFAGDPRFGGVELGPDGGYARVLIVNDGTTWPTAPDGGAITSIPVPFGISTGAYSDVATHFVLIPTDGSGDYGDAQQLAAPVSVDAAGSVVTPTLTVFYNPIAA